jgi:hypothetical protein
MRKHYSIYPNTPQNRIIRIVKPKVLNLEEACRLYDLIGEFFPTEEVKAIEAIHSMVVKMGAETYFKMLELLTGEEEEALADMDKNERLSILFSAWEQNKLFELPRLKQDGFCDR